MTGVRFALMRSVFGIRLSQPTSASASALANGF